MYNEKTKDLISNSVKKYGDVIIDPNNIIPCDVISTGSIAADIATGIGGIARGRITEIFGEESSGKTTLALQVVAQTQKAGGIVAYIDAEHALDPTYAKNLGVNLDDLVMVQPTYAEQAFDIIKDFLNTGIFSAIVVDSIAALVPKAILNGEMEDQFMGVMGRVMSRAMQLLVGPCSSGNTALILINQVRSTMSTSYMTGPPETTTSGRALKFYASMRIQVKKGAKVKDGDDVTASRTRVIVVKNKLAAPFKEAESEIKFGEGFNLIGELIDIGVELKIVEKSGSWYSYKGERLGQGRDNSCDFLTVNPDIAAEIEAKIRSAYNI